MKSLIMIDHADKRWIKHFQDEQEIILKDNLEAQAKTAAFAIVLTCLMATGALFALIL
jgi:tRNA isopentenyl-2-thiomethyl-A-37 hydroxylase MiaE